jgi:hypothetical protein
MLQSNSAQDKTVGFLEDADGNVATEVPHVIDAASSSKPAAPRTDKKQSTQALQNCKTGICDEAHERMGARTQAERNIQDPTRRACDHKQQSSGET